MKEEIKDEKLVRAMNEVSKNFSDKPHHHKASEIINLGGGTPSNSIDINRICKVYTEWGKKYVEFYGNYKNKARSIEELQPLIKLLDEDKYEWI